MYTFARTLHVRDLLLTYPRHWLARELAEEVWASRAEIESDLRELTAAGVPIEWEETGDDDERLYFISGDPYRLDHEYGGPMPPLRLRAEQPLLETLSEAETVNVLDRPPEGFRPRNGWAINRLRKGIDERRAVRITYSPRDSKDPLTFDVEPLEYFSAAKLWYFRVQMLPGRETRTLASWRIREVQLLEPGPKLSRRAHGKAFGNYTGPAEHVVVRFDRSLADFIKERHWHPSQRMTPMPDGTLIWRAYLSGMREFVGWVMSWGPRAKLLAPDDWAEEVQKRVKAMAEQYAAPENALH